MKSIDDILSSLRDLTYADKLRWEDDGAISNSFRTSLSEHKVRVFQWTDEDDGTTGVTIQLYTGSGFNNIIDQSIANQFSSKYSALHDVYVAARRSARNVNDTIKGLEEVLKKLGSS